MSIRKNPDDPKRPDVDPKKEVSFFGGTLNKLRYGLVFVCRYPLRFAVRHWIIGSALSIPAFIYIGMAVVEYHTVLYAPIFKIQGEIPVGATADERRQIVQPKAGVAIVDILIKMLVRERNIWSPTAAWGTPTRTLLVGPQAYQLARINVIQRILGNLATSLQREGGKRDKSGNDALAQAQKVLNSSTANEWRVVYSFESSMDDAVQSLKDFRDDLIRGNVRVYATPESFGAVLKVAIQMLQEEEDLLARAGRFTDTARMTAHTLDDSTSRGEEVLNPEQYRVPVSDINPNYRRAQGVEGAVREVLRAMLVDWMRIIVDKNADEFFQKIILEMEPYFFAQSPVFGIILNGAPNGWWPNHSRYLMSELAGARANLMLLQVQVTGTLNK